MINNTLALEALRRVNFEWTMHTKSVWQSVQNDVDKIHYQQRRKIIAELESLRDRDVVASPLGLPVIGVAGSGKTHLIAAARAYTQQQQLAFVLVDMTDVHNFWDTVLQGYVNSLQVPDGDGVPQFQKLLDFLIQYSAVNFTRQHLAEAEPRNLNWFSMTLLSALSRHHRREVMSYQDGVRALVLLNSNEFIIQNLGYSWLLGVDIDEENKHIYNFAKTIASEASQRVEGISWLMSLRSPTLLAIDQMDSIVTQHHLAVGSTVDEQMSDEQRVSRAIIEGIGGGLIGLLDKTMRTLTLVSALEATWDILSKKTVSSFPDRFQDRLSLSPISNQDTAVELITQRLKIAYQSAAFVPPYPTWPFTAKFFTEASHHYPRRILQRCHQHRDTCLAEKQVWELDTIEGGGQVTIVDIHDFHKLDKALQAAKGQVDPTILLDEKHEDEYLGKLIKLICHWLIVENPTPDSIDTTIDTEFGGGNRTHPLHARLRLIFRDERDREQHLSLRSLQHKNPLAYQSRLKAALSESGIDRSLSFRHLAIVRNTELPGTPKAEAWTTEFHRKGGIFTKPCEDDLRTLLALEKLQHEISFLPWLRSRRPVSNLSFLREPVAWLYKDTKVNKPINGKVETTPGLVKLPPIDPPPIVPPPTKQLLPVGQRLIANHANNAVTVALEDLRKHVVVLAGSGAGKTVLVKRLIEEAALLKVPAIVIDGANDLARLGDRWPSAPEGWFAGDAAKAEAYHQQSQVVIWTPGRDGGNPLSLEPLPDLTATTGDPDEFNLAVSMASEALQEIVAPGKGHTDKLKRGILHSALTYFAHFQQQGLENFVTFLSDLPPEAGGGINDAEKKARDMADHLRAAMLINPLLRQTSTTLDPAVLFGLENPSDRTRISVLNLSGLAGLNTQQQFVNQLAMTLFTWIKKHPAPVDQPLRGLLVIDEAKDFIPSRSSTPCKASLLRLAAQARKYGLGLVFATQEPKSIDHGVTGNCSTQFFGKAGAPASIEVVKEQIRARGGDGSDIAKLERGQFYAALEGAKSPVKIQVPLCLSYHAASPLNEEEVLARAAAARQQVHA